jgi:hypothetical protein
MIGLEKEESQVMRIGALKNAVTTVALGLAAWCTISTIHAQPLFDRVNVNLPYTVTIGKHTLQPGEYTIQQLPTMSGDSRTLLIYSNNGMKFETSAMSIPALDPNTARSTKVILHHFGDDYYMDKIWVQGKDYGYEFPLPDNVKSREKERNESVTVAGNYSSTQSTDTNTTTTTASNEQTAPPPVTDNSQSQSTQADNTAVTTPPPVTDNSANTPPPVTDNSVNSTPPDTAMNQSNQSSISDQNSANRSTDDTNANASNDNNSMPRTSAGWLMMLLSGGALSGAGLSLRRKR